MILNCEKCQTRYIVPDSNIGAKGQRVRCTNCQHEWFEPPLVEDEDMAEALYGTGESEDDSEEQTPLDISDIADDSDEGDEPLAEITADLDEKPAQDQPKAAMLVTNAKRSWASSAAVFLVFVLVISLFFAFRKPIVDAVPTTIVAYDAVGATPEIEGQKLVFEGMNAVLKVGEDKTRTFTVSGTIINLAATEKAIPRVKIILLDLAKIEAGDEAQDFWFIDTLPRSIEAEGSITFETSYPQIPETVKEVTVRFVPY
jgi:predicted Zn finger-like uncharacterized protein